jgi:hypothetical protein
MLHKDRIAKFKERMKSVGKNLERDYSVLELLARHPEIHQEEVASILKEDISQPRVSQLLKDNQSLYLDMVMTLNPLCTKEGRITELIKHYKRKRGNSKKDHIEIIEQVRKEIDGDKATVDMSSHTHYTIVKNNNGNKPVDRPRTKFEELLGEPGKV